MGSEASLWAPHTWLEGLPDLNLTPERVGFLAQGNSCIPLTRQQRRKVRGLFFSLLRTCHLVLQTSTRSICCCFRNKTNTEIMCHPTLLAFICKHTVPRTDPSARSSQVQKLHHIVSRTFLIFILAQLKLDWTIFTHHYCHDKRNVIKKIASLAVLAAPALLLCTLRRIKD